jgi:hypothetical protein
VTVTVFSPASSPALGDTDVTVGATYRKPPEREMGVPPLGVTTTSRAPAAPAGVVATIWVGDDETTVAGVPPMLTAGSDPKPDPEMVTFVPPVVGPVPGTTEEIDT